MTTAEELQTLVSKILGTGWKWVRGFGPEHSGVDFGAPLGTPVYAFEGGTIVYARDASSDPNAGKAHAGGGGNVVNVRLGNGSLTEQYAHLDTIAVKSGDVIKTGQLIGTVGQTGNATGPHLHFALFKDDLFGGMSALDPLVTLIAYATLKAKGEDPTTGLDPLGSIAGAIGSFGDVVIKAITYVIAVGIIFVGVWLYSKGGSTAPQIEVPT
jgi:murein DD-endopeptidase MepM/ murein hydrolase activator NlpD